MKGNSILWVALALLGYSYLRKGQAVQAAAASAAPVTVNADTNIIDEDKTGEALERLITALDAQAKFSGPEAFTYFAFEGPDGTTVNYRNKPYQLTKYNPRTQRFAPFNP